MIFYSLAPYLKSERGHDIIYHQAVKEAAFSSGYSFTCYCASFTKIALPDDYKPYFRKSKKGLFGFCLRLSEFKKLLRINFTERKRIFFMESFHLSDLLALSFASCFFSKPKDHVFILFRTDFHLRRKVSTLVALHLLSWKLKDHLKLLSDSLLICKSFPMIGTHLAIPHTDLALKTPSEPSEKITCLFPGSPRKEKGLHEIEHLLSIKDPKAPFFELRVAEDAHLTLSINNLAIRTTKTSLSREEYIQELLRSDFIFLPYDAKIYRQSTSGIFVEAVCAGKIPLVKEGSWLASELKENNLRELIVDWKNPLFFSHLLSLKKDEKLLQKLKAFQSHYRKFHSMTTFKKQWRALL